MAHVPRRFLTQKTAGRPARDAHIPARPACQRDHYRACTKRTAPFCQGEPDDCVPLAQIPCPPSARPTGRKTPLSQASDFPAETTAQTSRHSSGSTTQHPARRDALSSRPKYPPLPAAPGAHLSPKGTPENASFSDAFSASENATRGTALTLTTADFAVRCVHTACCTACCTVGLHQRLHGPNDRCVTLPQARAKD